MINNFDMFLKESERVKIKKELREYSLSEISDGNFVLKSDDLQKKFSVLPFKKEVVEKIRDLYPSLLSALDDNYAAKMLSAIEHAERLDYSFGNVFSAKINIQDIGGTSFTPEQFQAVKNSQRQFLLNDFSSLSKDDQEKILKFLRERLEVICGVIEALFFYIRKTDKESFYKGLNSQEIIEEYKKALEKASSYFSFSFDGPYGNKFSSPIAKDTKVAYWNCEREDKKFIVFGTISPKEIYAEDKIGGIETLKLSISELDKDSNEKYKYFDIEQLPQKVKDFYKKVL